MICRLLELELNHEILLPDCTANEVVLEGVQLIGFIPPNVVDDLEESDLMI